MQAVFEMQVRETDPELALDANVLEFGGTNHVDAVFAKNLLAGVRKEWSAMREAIEAHAPQWPLDRMDSITRSILMIGAFELLYALDAPPAVVMNEAIDIAKEYGTEESAKFVNGVLNALAHRDTTKKK